MSRQERTGWRDEAFSRWHRGIEPDNRLTAIDCDWLEYCARCRAPLAIFELCADPSRTDKTYTVTRKLARQAGVPAWCVLYRASPGGRGIEAVRVKKIAPRDDGGWMRVSPAALARFIRRLHATCPHCGLATTPEKNLPESSGRITREGAKAS